MAYPQYKEGAALRFRRYFILVLMMVAGFMQTANAETDLRKCLQGPDFVIGTVASWTQKDDKLFIMLDDGSRWQAGTGELSTLEYVEKSKDGLAMITGDKSAGRMEQLLFPHRFSFMSLGPEHEGAHDVLFMPSAAVYTLYKERPWYAETIRILTEEQEKSAAPEFEPALDVFFDVTCGMEILAVRPVPEDKR